jgi:hypothetical protein
LVPEDRFHRRNSCSDAHHVHLFLAWIFGASYVSGGSNAAWSSLLFMVLLFLYVLAREFGRVLTAREFGVLTPDVILLPIGGVARLERIP